MLDRASQILNRLQESPVATAEPGFQVTTRIFYGVHGEEDELALSVEWLDADGYMWAADFSEDALAVAELQGGTITMRDTVGTKVVFQLYQTEKQILLAAN